MFFTFTMLVAMVVTMIFGHFFCFPCSPFVYVPVLLFAIVKCCICSPSANSKGTGGSRSIFRLVYRRKGVLFCCMESGFLICNNTKSKGATSVKGPLLRRCVGRR